MSDKKFNERLAWGKPTKVGYWSDTIGAKEYDALQKIEIGGKISLRRMKCKNKKTGEDFEGVVFEYISPEQVTQLKESAKKFSKAKEEKKESDTDF